MKTEFDYRRAVNDLSFSKEQKAEMTRKLVEAVGQDTTSQERKRYIHPIGRVAILAACLAGALAITTGATGVLKNAGDAFANVFGGGTAETEIVNRIGRPIGASTTDGGLTITADAVIGDRTSVCVVYTITRDDGEIFDIQGNEFGYLPLMFEDGDLDTGILGGSHGGSYFTDPVPGDNSIQYVQQRSCDVPVVGNSAKAQLRNLWLIGEDGKPTTLAEGKWKLNFELNYEDSSMILDGNGKTFRQHDMTYTVDSIQISPVGISVSYTVDQELVWSDQASGQTSPEDAESMRRYLENVEILLVGIDGTVTDLSSSGGSISPKNGVTECIKSRMFDSIQQLDHIAAIRVGGVEFPLR